MGDGETQQQKKEQVQNSCRDERFCFYNSTRRSRRVWAPRSSAHAVPWFLASVPSATVPWLKSRAANNFTRQTAESPFIWIDHGLYRCMLIASKMTSITQLNRNSFFNVVSLDWTSMVLCSSLLLGRCHWSNLLNLMRQRPLDSIPAVFKFRN